MAAPPRMIMPWTVTLFKDVGKSSQTDYTNSLWMYIPYQECSEYYTSNRFKWINKTFLFPPVVHKELLIQRRRRQTRWHPTGFPLYKKKRISSHKSSIVSYYKLHHLPSGHKEHNKAVLQNDKSILSFFMHSTIWTELPSQDLHLLCGKRKRQNYITRTHISVIKQEKNREFQTYFIKFCFFTCTLITSWTLKGCIGL